MKTTTKKQGVKQLLPVSKKFYSELRERVANACGIVMKGYEYVDGMMTVIDSYIFKAVEPAPTTDRDTLLIFTLLKPEMDRALRRSALARQRAAKRRENDRIALPDTTDNDNDSDTPKTPDTITLNRRQRRLIEQELKRQARKQAKNRPTPQKAPCHRKN